MSDHKTRQRKRPQRDRPSLAAMKRDLAGRSIPLTPKYLGTLPRSTRKFLLEKRS